MHDIRFIRENPAAFDAALARRGLEPMSAELLAIDADRRLAIQAKQALDEGRNASARAAGEAKARNDEVQFNFFRDDALRLKKEVAELGGEATLLDAKLDDALSRIPNLPLDEVPDGPDETANVEIRRWGTPRNFEFTAKEHFEIAGIKARGMAFGAAARISGSRFVFLTDSVARVHRALGQFMLDLHTSEHALREIWAPVLVNTQAMYGTGQLPKFAEDSYQTTDGMWLVPTAEVSLTNLAAGGVLDAYIDEDTLPWRMTAHTQCFRSEAGSAGKDTTGMLRQHQFEKVEMVTICTPETALAEHERMTKCAEAVLERLGLPYRKIILCTGDMGFGSQKTYDLEVWLPGQNTYREISSCSTCGQFQARRMNARYRQSGGNAEYVATLNGSGLAVGRCMIAVLENGQQADGSVDLPAVLHPYLGGKSRIDAEGRLV
jgi:seryl-tRNA synthetase